MSLEANHRTAVDEVDDCGTGKKKPRAKKEVKPTIIKVTKKEQQLIDIAASTILPDDYFMCWTQQDVQHMVSFLEKCPLIAVDTETTGLHVFKDKIVGMSLFGMTREKERKGFYLPFRHYHDIRVSPEKRKEYEAHKDTFILGRDFVLCLDKKDTADKLRPLLQDRSKKFLLANSKFDQHVMVNNLGIVVKPFFDVLIASRLIDENSIHKLKILATKYLGVEASTFSSLFGKMIFDRVPVLTSADRTGCISGYYAIKDTELTYDMFMLFYKMLKQPKNEYLMYLMFDIEMPVSDIMFTAEHYGCAFDSDRMIDEVIPRLTKDMNAAYVKLLKRGAEGVNFNAPGQVANFLFNDLALPRLNPKKPDATGKKVLEKLARKGYGVAKEVLAYRNASKVLSSFGESLVEKVVNGTIHPSFNTIGTVTGRFSCQNPNTQNMPSGNLIRNSFIARPGKLLAAIDYSGQELRLLAHISGDEKMLQDFRDGLDIHSSVGVYIWNKDNPYDQIPYEEFQRLRKVADVLSDETGEFTDDLWGHDFEMEQCITEGVLLQAEAADVDHAKKMWQKGKEIEKTRKKAKFTGFGIVYGISKVGLAAQLDVPEDGAQKYINQFLELYSGVKAWMSRTEAFAKRFGYTQTILKRRRRVYREVNSGKNWLISKGVRMAMNAVIQGSAADQVKLALIALQPLLRELNCKVILQVHDEILFEVPENIGMENLKRIAKVMEEVYPLDCPVFSDIEVGKRWAYKMDDVEIENLRNAAEAEEGEGD